MAPDPSTPPGPSRDTASLRDEDDGVEIVVSAYTDVGRVRDENQDTFAVVVPAFEPDGSSLHIASDDPDADGNEARRFTPGPVGALLLVCDGMGGVAGGARASALATDAMVTNFQRAAESPGSAPPSPDDFEHRLRTGVERANEAVYREARTKGLEGMGTTATAVGLLGWRLHVAQVGDSRVYLIRDGAALQLTRDQTMGQDLVDRGAMTHAEARHSVHQHILTQAVGTEPAIDVALSRTPIRPGDTVLLCSDGLSGAVEGSEIAALVEGADDPAALARKLVEVANQRGGQDNITVVIARVLPSSPAEPGDGSDE